MYYEKIPIELHAIIIESVEKKDYRKLLMIHNEYKLTNFNYTCCGIDGLVEHYKHGIEIGAIKID